MKRAYWCIFTTILLSLFFASTIYAATEYSIVDDGFELLGNNKVNAINDSGQMVGFIFDGRRSFIWDDGVFTWIDPSGIAYDINNARKVVGEFGLWDNNEITQLGFTGRAINELGHVAGLSGNNAYFWQNGITTPLISLGGGSGGQAFGINDSDQVVGWSYNFNGEWRACVWENGTPIDLDIALDNDSVAYGINNSGHVVGMVKSYQLPPFYWENGIHIKLSNVGGTAWSINNQGQVVGYLRAGEEYIGAFIWENGILTNLNDVIDPSSSYDKIMEAYDINNLGQIACWGLISGKWSGLVLNPITFNANAGDEITLSHSTQNNATLEGTATCSNNDILMYRWLENDTEITNWEPVGSNGEAYLVLNEVPDFGIGLHTLTLEVKHYGRVNATDQVILNILESVNNPPIADAGENITIASEQQSLTSIQGNGIDPENDALTYRWMEGSDVLLDWQSAGTAGEAILDLSTVQYFSIGQHFLTLEVSDGQTTSGDEMILTVDNSAPHAAPTGGGVYEIWSDVTLGGQVSDFDADQLSYGWYEGSNLLFSGNQQTVYGGDPIVLPEHIINDLSLGTHILTLNVEDGINDLVTSDISVEIVDTNVPTLAPLPNKTILWPPNHKMVDIIIEANAIDNSGVVTLSVEIESNEPQDGLDDDDVNPDWTEPVIDHVNGLISFHLRSERSGSGDGRVYTVTITAVDGSGNASDAVFEIIVPHDKSKK